MARIFKSVGLRTVKNRQKVQAFTKQLLLMNGKLLEIKIFSRKVQAKFWFHPFYC